MGKAQAVLRTNYRIDSVSDVISCTEELSRIVPSAQIVARFQLGFEHEKAPGTGDVVVSVFPFSNDLVDGLVRWRDRKPQDNARVAVSSKVAADFGVGPGQRLDVGGVQLTIDSVFSFPALPSHKEIWLSPDLVAEKWGPEVPVATVAWYSSELPAEAGQKLFDAGYRQTPRGLAVAASEFPDPRVPLGSGGMLACAAILLAIGMMFLGRLDRHDVRALMGLGAVHSRQLRIATGVYVVRALPSIIGVLGGMVAARIVLAVTAQMSGLDYGPFALDAGALLIWLAFVVVLLVPYLLSLVWEPGAFRGYRRYSRLAGRRPWQWRLPIRDAANERGLTFVSFAGLSIIIAAMVVALTLLNMSQNQQAILRSIPKPADSVLRIDTGNTTLSPEKVASIAQEHDAEVAQISWASFPQKGQDIDTVALNSSVLNCSRQAYMASKTSGIFDRRHCLRSAQDLLPDKLAALAHVDDVERLTGKPMSSQARADYRSHVACIGVSCPATIELTGLSTDAPVVPIAAMNLDGPHLGLGMPQLLIDPQLAATLGIEGHGSPPLPDGTLFPSPFSSRSLVVKGHVAPPDLPLLMQHLRDAGVDTPRIDPPIETSVEAAQAQFQLAALLLVALSALLFGVLAHARVVRLDQALRQLSLLGVPQVRLRIWTALVLLAHTLLPWLVGGTGGLVATYFFFKAHELDAYFGLSPYLGMAAVVALAAVLFNVRHVGQAKH